LDYHREARATLLSAPRPTRSGQSEYLTANHLVSDFRRQLRHLLAYRSHLGPIDVIGRQQLNLGDDR
jgi:hypothetical protein